MVLAAGGVWARWGAPEERTVSVHKTTPHLSPPMTATPVAQRPPASSMPRRPTTTTRVVSAVTATLPDPKPQQTTTTAAPAQSAATRREALEACLALAAANHYEVIAANEMWYQQQLGFLTAHRMLASPQYAEPQIEEPHALVEIDAQYAIDQSNCYLN
jgi:hypothetical protein